MLQHGPVVSAEVWLTFRAVYDNGIDLAARALDLEGRREHRAAHADDAGLTDARDDSVRVRSCSSVSGFMSSQGVSWKSFSMTTDMTMSPSMWRLGSTAMTLPETDECTEADTGASLRAYELAHLHRVAHLDDGLVRGAICWIIGSTTTGGGEMVRTGVLLAVFA